MYAIVIIVCLLSIGGKCIPLAEEPPKYYETNEECHEQMLISATKAIEQLKDTEEQGQLQGLCVYVPEVKPA